MPRDECLRPCFAAESRPLVHLSFFWRGGLGLAQLHKGTSFDRYPEIFRTAQARVAQKSGPGLNGSSLRILSFGCSDGDEMDTIRAYFPDAQIFGCDIDLDAAKSRDRLPGRVFLSTRDNVLEHGPYDVIFACSVLCRHPLPRNKTVPDLFPFTEFVDLATWIDDALAGDGLFCLYNGSYLFEELPFASAYRPIRSGLISENGFLSKWHSTGQQVTRRVKKHGKNQHVILRSDLLAGDASLRDCIFERCQGMPIEVAIPEAQLLPGNVTPTAPPLNWQARIARFLKLRPRS